MASVEKSIEVNVPVRAAYDQWTQFEEFPRFMEGVREVRQVDDKRLHWRVEVGGDEAEWDAEITEQTPDQIIAWQSTSGSKNAGAVSFSPIDPNRTRVTVRIDYDPTAIVDRVGVDRLVARGEGGLERFKEFIESRGAATGAWRGEIHAGQVERGATGAGS